MSYVDAYHDRKTDRIRVSERINGRRILRELKPVYEVYTLDPKGSTLSITGENCTRHTFLTNKEFRTFIQECKKNNTRMFESDVSPLFKTMQRTYKNEKSPDLNVVFFDIEVDFNQEKGYAPVHDPFNKITAFSLFFKNTKMHYCLVLPPENLSWEEAQEIQKTFQNPENPNQIVRLCTSEEEMIYEFLELIEDADVLSGWNSEIFDIPYIVNRIKLVLGSHEVARLCLWNQQPKTKIVDNYGNDVETYELLGRVHLDYMDLYKKHSMGEEPSYSLNAIASVVTGEIKVPYQGSLDDLYHDDFRSFIDYSLQDTNLLYLIDIKKNHIESHNQLAHSEYVLITTTLGTVGLVDSAIINEINRSSQVVFDKPEKDSDDSSAAGAWVQDPVVGLHEEIGCSDFNSLYPSVIRSLNMSPETIIGQVQQNYTQKFLDKEIEKQKAASRSKSFEPSYTHAWNPLFSSVEYTMIMDKTDDMLHVDLDTGEGIDCTASELYELIFSPESTILISANGTLFDKTKTGIIPVILAKWYSERKLYKRASGDCKQLSAKAALENEKGFTDDEMNKTYDGVTRFDWFKEHEPTMKLFKKNDKWYAEDPEYAYSRYEYYDMIQYIKKILLNSLYGALLNSHCRFYDKRLGQSTTLTGRRMAKHLASKLNEVITGDYIHYGGAVVYGDSVTGDTLIDTNQGLVSIEELYEKSSILKDWESEYKYSPNYNGSDIKIRTFDKLTNETYYEYPERILKHSNSSRYEVLAEDGSKVVCTSDHGIVAEVDGDILTCSPTQLQEYLEEGKEVYLIGS